VDLQVPDATRARAFYGTVLGWGFQPGTEPGYWHPQRPDGAFTGPMPGLRGGGAEARAVPMFRGPDVATGGAAGRAAGGET
ncbi:VOC family protein, partial [Bacteroides intestinalis]|uniref:VOC family protein n=1 Tax=Bacteroides intestinalis TaxID=329854 RepID=UPI001EDDCC72